MQALPCRSSKADNDLSTRLDCSLPLKNARLYIRLIAIHLGI